MVEKASLAACGCSSFFSAGFIVGGASNQGLCCEGGKTVSYHHLDRRLGRPAGRRAVMIVFILFRDRRFTLDRFKASNGWTVWLPA